MPFGSHCLTDGQGTAQRRHLVVILRRQAYHDAGEMRRESAARIRQVVLEVDWVADGRSRRLAMSFLDWLS